VKSACCLPGAEGSTPIRGKGLLGPVDISHFSPKILKKQHGLFKDGFMGSVQRFPKSISNGVDSNLENFI
jgi:hypothetical protein